MNNKNKEYIEYIVDNIDLFTQKYPSKDGLFVLQLNIKDQSVNIVFTRIYNLASLSKMNNELNYYYMNYNEDIIIIESENSHLDFNKFDKKNSSLMLKIKSKLATNEDGIITNEPAYWVIKYEDGKRYFKEVPLLSPIYRFPY